MSKKPLSQAEARLQEASALVARRNRAQAQAFADSRAEEEVLRELRHSAEDALSQISVLLLRRIQSIAPESVVGNVPRSLASISLGTSVLSVAGVRDEDKQVRWYKQDFRVVAASSITLRTLRDSDGKEGMEHSLWYCHQAEKDTVRWYELGFKMCPPYRAPGIFDPFQLPLEKTTDVEHALDPGVVHPVTAAIHPTTIDQGDEDEFVQRWMNHIARAVTTSG